MEKPSLWNEDCLKTLKRMEEDELDLTVTSPPYNVDLGNNKEEKEGYDEYDDNLPYEEYLSWMEKVFKRVKDKTCLGGRCVINIGDGENGARSTHARIINFMEEMGWNIRTTIMWHKQEIANRCSWGSFESPSCPSFPTPFEYVLVFGNETKKLQTDGDTDLEKQEFIDWSLARWDFPGQSHSDHPAPFPEELPKRCIKMLSWTNATVYDPFAGSGTTLKVADELRRDWIGSEISENYFEMAKERIREGRNGNS